MDIKEKPAEDGRNSVVQKVTQKVKAAKDTTEDGWLEAELPEFIRKHVTFYRLHVAYFLFLWIFGVLILYLAHRSDAGERHFSMVDSIYNVISVLTVTGLLTVRIADLSTFDQMLFLILMILGSPSFTSLIPLSVRRFYFFRHHRMYEKQRMKELNAMSPPKSETPVKRFKFPWSTKPGLYHGEEEHRVQRHGDAAVTFAATSIFAKKHHFISSPERNSMGQPGQAHQFSRDLNVDIVRTFDNSPPNDNQVLETRETSDPTIEGAPNPDGSLKPVQQGPSYNRSASFNIMRTIEHRALVVLSWLVPIYIVVVQLLAIVISLVVFAASRSATKILKTRHLNTAFFSFFTAIATFTNSGIPVSDDNMVPFESQIVLILLYTTVSLMGNLLYPAFLRLIIGGLHRFGSETKKPVYAYLLNYPRRCFTHLFPHKQTIWLCLTVIGFTGFQLIFFCALDWHSIAVQGLNSAAKIVDGTFQSVSARNLGATVVNIDELSAANVMLFLFMMFIGVYPVALLRQNSMDYEDADIGIYDKKWEEDLTENSVTFQSRKLLARDSACLCAILLSICIIETVHINNDPLNYSLFSIIFEVVSAYGGVGLSLGYSCKLRVMQGDTPLGPCTDVPYSFSGKWSPGGKLLLALTMFLGRHRGLPADIDSAVKLPHFSHNTPAAAGAKTVSSKSGGATFGQLPAAEPQQSSDGLGKSHFSAFANYPSHTGTQDLENWKV